ncbi:MAG: ribonuclease III [Bacteroidota bacterium]
MNLFRRLVDFISKGGSGGRTDAVSEVDFEQLGKALQYQIKNTGIFSEALSHRSYLQEQGPGNSISYERLEFLGDSILNFIVAEHLFHQHTSAEEGDLTKIRSRLVNRKSLNVYSKQTHLEKYILMSDNVSRLGERGTEKILADAFEAVIAAVYLDGGFEEARRLVEREMQTAINSGAIKMEDENFKSQLLEYSQGVGFGVPRYVTVHEEGPDHDRTFTIEVYLEYKPYGVGMGKNKKDAEQAAAEEALQKIQAIG